MNVFLALLLWGQGRFDERLLNSVFETCENGDWVKKYPPYDIGTYPISGRQSSVEDHSIEVAADMLMMTLAIVELENVLTMRKSTGDCYSSGLLIWRHVFRMNLLFLLNY